MTASKQRSNRKHHNASYERTLMRSGTVISFDKRTSVNLQQCAFQWFPFCTKDRKIGVCLATICKPKHLGLCLLFLWGLSRTSAYFSCLIISWPWSPYRPLLHRHVNGSPNRHDLPLKKLSTTGSGLPDPNLFLQHHDRFY